MTRVFWTADFAEAHIVAGLLRANGIAVSVFDAGMAQLNWLQTLAIGGYRVMARATDAPAALHVIAAYRKGELTRSDVQANEPACPTCLGDHNVENRNPRRVAFAFLLMGGGELVFEGLFFVFLEWASLAFTLAPQVFVLLCTAIVSGLFVLLTRLLNRRHRCTSCATTWQAEMSDFGALSRAVDAAEVEHPNPQ